MNAMSIRLPKIAPTVAPRSKMQAWLEFHADVALRFVHAPAGSGKTTVAIMYARTRANLVGYVRVRPDTTPRELFAAIGHAVGLGGIDDYDTLLHRLVELSRVEIIVDDVDRACAPVLDALQRIYHDVVDVVTFIYLSRSPEAMLAVTSDALGLVATCDPGLLMFRTDEIALFVQALGLSEDPLSIARLQRATFGWAAAVAGVCRDAASNSRRLRESWPRWRQLARDSLAQMVTDAVRNVPADVAAAFNDVVSGTILPDQRVLARFARFGLFVHEHDGYLALNAVIAPHSSPDRADADAGLRGRAQIEMFGRFELTIDGTPIVWQRRRDRQIIQYLAMQPEGSATRAQLIAAFWPHADRQLAAQSLRTACSTIRRAFAGCVGPANVAAFFVADHLVELKLEAVESSVAQFTAHIAHADRFYDARDVCAAYMHYAAAERLYIAPLLAGEPPVSWSESHAIGLAAMHVRASERLDELAHQVTSADVTGFRSIVNTQVRSA